MEDATITRWLVADTAPLTLNGARPVKFAVAFVRGSPSLNRSTNETLTVKAVAD